MIMGMPIVLTVHDDCPTKVMHDVFAVFEQANEVFSPYLRTSELNKYLNSEVTKPSDEFIEVHNLCEQYKQRTDGWFDAYYAGKYDPIGLVKAWAIQRAAHLLTELDINTFCINAGGDIYVTSDGEKRWTLALQHPIDSKQAMGSVRLYTGALATSGNYARGKHIIGKNGHSPQGDLASATVLGADIITADVLATCLFAMGPELAPKLMQQHHGYEYLLVDKGMRPHMSVGFAALTS